MTKRILAAVLALASTCALAQPNFLGEESVAVVSVAGSRILSSTGAVSILNYRFDRATSMWNLVAGNTKDLTALSGNAFGIRRNSTTEGTLQGSGPFTVGSESGVGYLYVGGQGVGADVTQTVAEASRKTIARMNVKTGAVDFVTNISNAATTPGTPYNTFRSVASADGVNFALGGVSSNSTTNGGVRTLAANSTVSNRVNGTAAPGGQVNVQAVDYFGGSLYFSTSSGIPSSQGIYRNTGNGTNEIVLALDNSAALGDFHLTDDGLTLFVAEGDDSGGRIGISRYTRTSTATAFAVADRTSVTSVGARQFGYAVWSNGPDFAAQENLFFSDETGTTVTQAYRPFGSTDTFASRNVATAATSQTFRGVASVPEPATMAAMALGLGALAARRRRKSA